MGQMAKELHSLLEASGEAGPYLLVGHSWGGGITRLYQAAYPEQVSGLVWIEATHPDAWKRRGVPESTFGGMNPQMVEGIPLITRLGIFRIFPALRGGWGVVPELPLLQQKSWCVF
jgi:pimeloyl-ACP methyl ester carboxylesterase